MRPWREPGDTSFQGRTGDASQPVKSRESSKRRKGGKVSPLIPPSRVSVPTQRFLVTAIFVALQAVKLASIMAGNLNFISKLLYTTFDVAFVWYLPAFAIPMLDFNSLVVWLQVFAMVSLDYTLFISSSWVWSSLAFILGFPTPTQIPNQSPHDHLLGRYIVHILPDTSARMDNIEPLCLGAGRVVAFAHLTFNATWPSALQLWRANFDGQVEETLNFTSKSIAKLPRKGKDELFVPLSNTGVYQLRSVQDAATGFAVNTYGVPLTVPPCPNAYFEASEEPLCASNGFYEASLVLNGLPPLRAVLSDGTTLEVPSSGNWNVSEDKVQLKYSLTPYPETGEAGFTVVEVSDGVGNTKETDLTISAPVIKNPSATVINNEVFPLVDETPVEVPIEIDGKDGPYVLDILHDNTKISISNVHEGKNLIKIDKPGFYALQTVHGQHCSGPAMGSFEVWIPPPLGLSVEFEPVQDECAGPTGTMADLHFSGSPPYRLHYKVGSQTWEASFDDSEGRVQFKPPGAGYYVYEITDLWDKYRHVRLEGHQYRREQQIAEIANAAFSGQGKFRYCSGQPAFMRVNLRGTPPLTLEWDVDGRNGMRREEGLRDSYVDLDLGVLRGGSHQVNLRRIIDSRGCVTQLGLKSQLIEVRTSPPSAKLGGPLTVFTLDPVNMKIPLETDGIAPFQITYEHSGALHTRSLAEPWLHVNDPGTYKLVEYSDAECPGIADDRQVEVQVHPRPSVEVGPIEPVCFPAEQHLDVRAQGVGPFKIWHEITYPNGFSEAFELSELPRKFTLNAPVSMAGQYVHSLWVADQRYPKAEEAAGPILVTRSVYEQPEAKFIRRHHKEVCAGRTEHKDDPLSVEFRGVPPFQLTFSASKRRQTALTNHTRLDLMQYLPPFKPGKNIVSLLSVRDGRGCESELDATETILARHAPSLSLPRERDYCVGDIIKADLQGQQPFSVDLRINDKNKRVSGSRSAQIPASQPGDITFLTIKDEGGCTVSVNETVLVHPLPSSEITHEPIFNIHSGDTAELSFRFKGSPPFTFTYTRSVDGQVKERKTIKKVQSHQYSIFTKENGVYEVVALQDKHCRVEI